MPLTRQYRKCCLEEGEWKEEAEEEKEEEGEKQEGEEEEGEAEEVST